MKKNEIIEWYFDVINKSGLENNIPYIEDLYLDIVITYLGEIFVLDEDELHQAFVNKDTDNKYCIGNRVNSICIC